uniref:Uncharacterized protein n=1 Tax=viral metagenome TaxID=1070528 RepID=A0A6M3J4E1_9ZZZZ
MADYSELGFDSLLDRSLDLTSIESSQTSVYNPVTSSTPTVSLESGEYSGNLILARDASIRGGATDYNEGSGFWLGYRRGTSDYGFFIGNSAGNKLTYNTTDDTLTLTGTITATAGSIGGWTISATAIKDTAGVVGLSSAVTGGDDIRFWAGHATPASAPFYVTEAGNLVATSATISGTITATAIHIPDQDTTANSMHVESDGDTWWGCTQTNFTSDPDNATAYILKDGQAKFQSVFNVTGSSGETVSSDGTNVVATGNLKNQDTFTAGENLVAGQALYLSNADGKVYKTDASDSGKVQFVGFATANASANNPILVRIGGIMTGLSGLTAGNRYYVADAGSNPSIDTAENGLFSNTWSGTSGNSKGLGMYYSITTPGKLSFITVSGLKNNGGGEPGDLQLDFFVNYPSGKAKYGGGGLLETVTVAAGDIGTSEQDIIFTFTEPLYLSPGTYCFTIHQKSGGACEGDRYYEIEESSTITGTGMVINRWDTPSTGAWAGGDRLAAIWGWESITKSAGDIHDYFFTNVKLVGIAISASELFILTDETRYSQGQITFSSTAPASVTLGYAPQMVMIQALAWSTSGDDIVIQSWGVATRGGQGCAYANYDTSAASAATATDATRIFRAWAYDNDNVTSQGGAGGISFTADGFILGVGNVAGDNVSIQWSALG